MKKENNDSEYCKCTRCRNVHLKSDRVEKIAINDAFAIIVCPRCGCKSYTRIEL